MGKAPADKRPPRRTPAEPKRIPGTRGSMKPDELIELMRQWMKEGDPEEDRAALQALREEMARARR